MITYELKFTHPELGELTTQQFSDQTQFRIFCKLVQSALALKEDLTTYDAKEMFIHIPYNVLVETIIVSNFYGITLPEYAKEKAKSSVKS